MTCSW